MSQFIVKTDFVSVRKNHIKCKTYLCTRKDVYSIKLGIKRNLMRKIECIIRPFKLEEVKEALSDVGVRGIRVSEVRGFRRSRRYTELYRDNEHVFDFMPKLKIEIVVAEEIIDEVVEAIKQVASTFKTDLVPSTAP